VVDGVDAASKFDVMKATGFRNRIDYRREDFTQKSEVYDIVIDNKMNRPIRRCLKVLKPGGRYLVIGGGSWSIFKVLMLSPLIHLFTNKRIQLVMLKKNRGLEYMEKLHLAGNLQVIMEPVVSIDKGIEAIEAYSRNDFTGKVVIDIAGKSK
jgi:NADPH:quinone reductase-like Zn-dependent oxidoreductase